MSDWEDYCDSNGWSIGSADDYDRFLNSLEEKSVVSTSTKSTPQVIHEYKSDVTIEELIADIEDCTLGGNSTDFSCEPWGWKLSGDELCDDFLDGLTHDYHQINCYTIRVRSAVRDGYWVSLRLFLDALRVSEIPVLVYNSVVAWDGSNQCLTVSKSFGYKLQSYAQQTICELEEKSKLVYFLERARSTEHGFKPMIIRRNEIENLISGEQVTFLDPTNMAISELMDCVLAYFNQRGKPKWIPMNDVLSETTLLVTRVGNFLADGKRVRAIHDVATLMSGAYFIAKKQRPFGGYRNLNISYYLRKESGTIFEPAFREITEKQASSKSFRRVYITDGSHPLAARSPLDDASFVTTYAHYEAAREKFKKYWATH